MSIAKLSGDLAANQLIHDGRVGIRRYLPMSALGDFNADNLREHRVGESFLLVVFRIGWLNLHGVKERDYPNQQFTLVVFGYRFIHPRDPINFHASLYN